MKIIEFMAVMKYLSNEYNLDICNAYNFFSSQRFDTLRFGYLKERVTKLQATYHKLGSLTY